MQPVERSAGYRKTEGKDKDSIPPPCWIWSTLNSSCLSLAVHPSPWLFVQNFIRRDGETSLLTKDEKMCGDSVLTFSGWDIQPRCRRPFFSGDMLTAIPHLLARLSWRGGTLSSQSPALLCTTLLGMRQLFLQSFHISRIFIYFS